MKLNLKSKDKSKPKLKICKKLICKHILAWSERTFYLLFWIFWRSFEMNDRQQSYTFYENYEYCIHYLIVRVENGLAAVQL